MTDKDLFIQLLKKKGTGKTMGKHLESHELSHLSTLLLSPTVHLTTKATLLTALLSLPATEAESMWLNKVKHNPKKQLPKELLPFFLPSQTGLWHRFIYPLLEQKDLSYTQAYACFKLVLTADSPELEKASILEALRLKRETLAENQACLDVCYTSTQRQTIKTPILLDIADAYDGFNRSYYLSPFLAALLGSMGYPTLLHGCYEVGPKFGMNSHKILKHAHKNTLTSLPNVCMSLDNPSIAWGYADQSLFHPGLSALNTLRINMVKRPLLATIEKFLQPVLASKSNYLISGYTHPPYKKMITDLLMSRPAYKKNKFLIFRGIEGSSLVPIDRRSPRLHWNGRRYTQDHVSPPNPQDYTPCYTYTAEDHLSAGETGLKGENKAIAIHLSYAAATLLSSFDLVSYKTAYQKAAASINSQKAWQHWQRGMQ